MAIGTLAAIGLGAGALSSVLGSKSQNKAATKAADTSLQVAGQNNALAGQIYGQNAATLSPYVQRGNAAGGALNAMLGLGGGYGMPAQSNPMGTYTTPGYAPPPGSVEDMGVPGGVIDPAMTEYGPKGWTGLVGEPAGYSAPVMGNALINGDTPMPPQAVAAPPQNAGDPFRSYIANSDYGFQFGQGANRVNSGYAGAGTLQSGAAMKALEDYRQNLQAGYRGEFNSLLANQQAAGLGAASAQAGVGQNYVNTVSSNNNNAGTAAANAALAKGANNPWANALGLLGGGLYGFAR